MIAAAIPVKCSALILVPVAMPVYMCSRIISGAMPTPEIKLNCRRFSRTMIQLVMKVNFDF